VQLSAPLISTLWLPVQNSSLWHADYVSYLKRFSCIRVNQCVNPVCARCHSVQITRATDSILASLAAVAFTTETSETDRGIIGRRFTSPSLEAWVLLATIYGTTCSLWNKKNNYDVIYHDKVLVYGPPSQDRFSPIYKQNDGRKMEC
jgi:hypothetical protein